MSVERLTNPLVALARRTVRIVRRMAKTGLPRPGGPRDRATALIERSPLFDAEWYVGKYPDVAAAGVEPAGHYATIGWKEGRDPGPLFSTKAYLKANADVARSRANPLLHFIEHGYAEGRGTSKHRAVVLRDASPGEPFGEAAPCHNFALEDEVPVRWKRASRFDQGSSDLFVIDELSIGHVSEGRKDEAERAFDWLRTLSGFGRGNCTAKPAESELQFALIDAWFVDQGRLRTRWQGKDAAFVIRTYQVHSCGDGRIELVGEGLSAGPTDFVDVQPSNRYFPLLFVICGTDGDVREFQFLAFPSLCRGGHHYPELIALSSGELAGPIEINKIANVLAERLLAISREDVVPLISSLVVDLEGGDGTEPLFDPDFQSWLARVARISVSSLRNSDGHTKGFLSLAVEIPKHGFRSIGGTLRLSANMIPTISALVHSASADLAGARVAVVSLIAVAAEPSQPATLIRLPASDAPSLRANVCGFPPAWPVITVPTGALSEDLPPAAIRLWSGRELADAELLIPNSTPARQTSQPQSVTWLIHLNDWAVDEFAATVESLALQFGGEAARLGLIGDANSMIVDLAQRFFGARVERWMDPALAAKSLKTDYAGYVGRGVILHDARCSQLLTDLLSDPAVVTASCVMVCAEDRGVGGHVTIEDAGRADGGSRISSLEAKGLWRGTYPVAKPPRDFWIAKSSSLDPCTDSVGLHICTSLVTACLPHSDNPAPVIEPPAPRQGQAIRLEALAG